MATLSTPTRTDPPKLQPLARRLNAWRATRSPGQRIPAEFWSAAAEVARVHGLSRTATALQLNYYDLQRRLSGAQMLPRRRVPVPGFIELTPPSVPPGLDDCGTLEWIDVSGARLILRLPKASPRELRPLVQMFLRRRA